MNLSIQKINIMLLPAYAFILSDVLIKFSSTSICLFKNLFNIECPGCGMTRALHCLFLLDIKGAYNYNPRVFIVALLFFVFWLKLLKKNFTNKNDKKTV